jgi:D-xylulose reductase
MKALVIEKKLRLWFREIAHPLNMGSRDVRILIGRVGIWGSDMNYYKHGRIGPFAVNAPMVLGHEAAGVVVAIGDGRTPKRELAGWPGPWTKARCDRMVAKKGDLSIHP